MKSILKNFFDKAKRHAGFISCGILATTFCTLYSSCVNEEEDLFDKSAIERLDESKGIYTDRFSSSPGGWVMEYYPTTALSAPTGCCYLLLADIRKDGTVTIGMDNELSGGYKESSSLWEIITDTGPVISFSTYNECLHYFCNPAIYKLGEGYGGDYEFIIIDMKEGAEMATIKGKKSGSYIRMTRLPEGTVFKDYLADVNGFLAKYFPSEAPNMLVLDLNGEKRYMRNSYSTIPNIYPMKGDSIADESYHPFMVTKRNDTYYLRFKNKFDVKGDEKSPVQEFVWDAEKQYFKGSDNELCSITSEVPADFWFNTMEPAKNTSWQWDLKSSMSETVSGIINNMNAQFKKVNKNYSLSFLQLTPITEKSCQLVIAYKTSKTATVKTYYNFDIEQSGENVKFTFTGAANTGAENIKVKVTAIQDMIDILNGDILIDDTGNPFNLKEIKLAPVSALDNWFIVK